MRIPSNHCPRTLGRYIKVFAIEARDIASPYWREDLSNQDRDFDVRLSVKAGLRSVGAGLVQRNWAMDSVGPSRLPVAYYYNFLGNGHAQKMGVGSIEITGPLNHSGRGDSTSRRQVFICRPSGGADDEICAKQILAKLAARAYRRPVSDQDLVAVLGVYETAREEGRDFDTGIQWALEQLLLRPEFLFRLERRPANVPAGAPFYISRLELASRLSFFLWSSMPDDELVDIASRGGLKSPGHSGTTDSPDVGRSSFEGTRAQLRRAVVALKEHGGGEPRCGCVS